MSSLLSLIDAPAVQDLSCEVFQSIQKAQDLLLSQQFEEGFWWYTLEANESIGAEFIFLLHLLGIQDQYSQIQQGLCRRILSQQSKEGSWSIYSGGPGDLSTTLECYCALKLAGYTIDSAPLKAAREFILEKGGVIQARIFTKIHLAQLGIVPWEACPSMPVWFVLFPSWAPANIYEFSSWARACIVPLLIVMEKKKVVQKHNFDLEELFLEPKGMRDFSLTTDKFPISLEGLFIQVDRLLKLKERFLPKTRLTELGLQKAEEWVIEHVSKTEDIYPALAYAILALDALGHPFSHPSIQKCFQALLSFQQRGKEELPALPSPAHAHPFSPPEAFQILPEETEAFIHQQCCISPVWDTPWAAVALLESGIPPSHEALIRAAHWLVSKQITETYGDWSIKNKKGKPGGWSFEFENEYFPDVDDTIEVLSLLNRVALPREELNPAFERGLAWLLSMQCANGGWGAFDIDNDSEWVNKIPFSDHGACLDPATPDITGRALELLGSLGYQKTHAFCEKALQFLWETQEADGSWWGRWGVNYLYGTWCVLQGLAAIGVDLTHPAIRKASFWLRSIQSEDGGWSESCESYLHRKHLPLPSSTASQTSWALMGLIAAGEAKSESVKQGIRFLISTQNAGGGWNEEAYTGTGFPGHFYIRYHGYRHYFPLLALAKYQASKK